jgi:hypothetical protein
MQKSWHRETASARRPDAVTAQARPPSRGRAIHHHYEGIITMTSTQENTRPVPLIGPAVGQAEASLTRLLTGILAESGTSRENYLGLQRLTALGGEATPDAYVRDLSDWLDEITRRARGIPAGPITTEGNR